MDRPWRATAMRRRSPVDWRTAPRSAGPLTQRRQLVLIVRETPLNRTHLRLMLEVTEAGGVILPPVPSFYHLPKTIDDIVNQTVQKALDQFGLEKNLFRRWQGMD